MKKLKIAFIAPFDLDWLTGTPIRAKTTIKAAAAFADVAVLSQGGSLPPQQVVKAKGGVFSFTKKAMELLKKKRPDIVHAFTSISTASAVLYKFFYDRKVKIVFEMHGWAWFESEGRMNIFKRLALLVLDICGFFLCDTVIAMSHSQAKFLKERLSKRKKIEVLWGPVDLDVVFEDLAEREIIKVGYLGNASSWQGLEIIIRSAEVLLANPKIEFELAGFDFSDEKRFPKLKNVSYFGKVPREKVKAFITGCDAMISARLKGNASSLQFPHKLSEYLACGRAIVSSNTNDEKQILEVANCGIICDPMNPQTLRDAICKIVAMSFDERNGLGKNASDFAAKNLSLDVFRNKLLDVYRELFVLPKTRDML